MMRPDPHFFDEMAKLAGGAASAFSGVQQQIREEIKTRIEELATRMDLVPREDLERVESILADAVKRIEDLEENKAGKAKK